VCKRAGKVRERLTSQTPKGQLESTKNDFWKGIKGCGNAWVMKGFNHHSKKSSEGAVGSETGVSLKIGLSRGGGRGRGDRFPGQQGMIGGLAGGQKVGILFNTGI